MQELKDRKQLSWQGMFYGLQRLDVLIITISGAGIYLCLETLKYLTDKCLEVHWVVKLSGGLFLLAMIINILSQLTGSKSNEFDYLMCEEEIKNREKPSEKSKKLIKVYDEKSERLNNITTYLNYASVVGLFLGLICIMIYFIFIF